jgi:hypothetical protein
VATILSSIAIAISALSAGFTYRNLRVTAARWHHDQMPDLEITAVDLDETPQQERRGIRIKNNGPSDYRAVTVLLLPADEVDEDGPPIRGFRAVNGMAAPTADFGALQVGDSRTVEVVDADRTPWGLPGGSVRLRCTCRVGRNKPWHVARTCEFQPPLGQTIY